MNFKAMREKAGLSVIKVACALEISAQSVYQWERDIAKPTTERLLEVAKLYGCTIDDLLMDK